MLISHLRYWCRVLRMGLRTWLLYFSALCVAIKAQDLLDLDDYDSCVTSGNQPGFCVYQYQCKDGVIIEDGDKIIDIRGAFDDCFDYLMKCCGNPSMLPPSSNLSTTLNEFPTDTTIIEENHSTETSTSNMANPTTETSATKPPPPGVEPPSTEGSGNRPGSNPVTTELPAPVPPKPSPHSGSTTMTPPLTTLPAKRPPIKIPPYEPKGCGVRNPHGVVFTIENNEHSESEYGEYPWTAAIFTRTEDDSLKYLCGGALIEPAAILTTATCIHGHYLKNSQLVVRLGEWDMSTDREPIPYVESGVDKMVFHPRYVASSKLNDIAVVILQDTVELNHTVGVVCLPPSELVDQNWGYIFGVGWGNVPDFIKPLKRPQTILKKAHLSYISHETCQNKLRKMIGQKFTLHHGFLCATADGIEMVACKGDSGSPYMMETVAGNDRYYLVGLSSWGYDCNRPNLPTVLTNIAYYREWIDNVMMDEHLSTRSYSFYSNDDWAEE